MPNVEVYRQRLSAMRKRLIARLDAERAEIGESGQRPGEQTHIHTHNADMDVEGIDESVGICHALSRRLRLVEQTVARLDREGETFLSDERERERLDGLLDTESP